MMGPPIGRYLGMLDRRQCARLAMRLNGVKLQLRLSFREQPGGSINLNAMVRPNDLSTWAISLATLSTGGWNSVFLGTLPSSATEVDFEAALARVRQGLHQDELTNLLLAA